MSTLTQESSTASIRATASEGRWRPIWRQLRRNRTAMLGLFITGVFVAVAIVGPYVTPYNPYKQSLIRQMQPPSMQYWMGTDEVGRDILSRIMVGAQLSLLISLAATFIASVAGTTLGAVAAYYGKMVDQIIMRAMDILLAMPGILLALAIIAALGTSLANVVLAIGIHSIPTFARLAHGSTLSAKEEEYVQAARALGATNAAILFRHVLPNIVAPLIVQFSLRIATAVTMAAGLSFLGLGAQPPTPEWGAMLSNARGYMRTAPHIAFFPGMVIFLTVTGLNLLGDGLRDALDPKLRT